MKSQFSDAKEPGNQKLLLKLPEIPLMLDGYDDIFSDFDPRGYSERALSVDFLNEAERASRDKSSGTIELDLLVPKRKREKNKEKTIKKRLKEHFKKHFQMLEDDYKQQIKNGILFAFIGILFMFLAAIILYQNSDSLTRSFLIILFEPAGWFMFWKGLEQAIFESKQIKPHRDFYKKMHECKINFLTY